jgi:hypothetical protein
MRGDALVAPRDVGIDLAPLVLQALQRYRDFLLCQAVLVFVFNASTQICG